MVSAIEIKGLIASLLKSAVSLADFEDWIAGHTWNVRESGDEAAILLAHSVELRLSEHSGGHLSEQQLRRELALLLDNSIHFISIEGPSQTGSSNLQIHQGALNWSQWQPVDISIEAVPS